MSRPTLRQAEFAASVAEQTIRVAPTLRRAAQRVLTVCALAFGLVLAGCSMFSGTSAKQAVAAVDWSAAGDAILVQLDADDLLNEYNNEPHTLLLGVVQTADADSFRKLSADAGTLASTLGEAAPNPAILQLTRYVVQPGGHTILSIDRAAKAKMVGLIAGFYTMDPASSARLFEIPLAISNQAFVGHDYAAQPQTLALRLSLGRDAISDAARLNPEPPQIVAAQKRAQAKQQIVPLDGGGKEVPLTPSNGAADTATIKLPN
ncbi:type VI secretion lipoprotein TssJ [Caballeronia sp. LP006]|jgi:type VI secretion system VasD/TssJ family lipoprotein|uniref:type VI secretion lipoprotein TssJ n=1 Tax=unclassified Caballeronia TaxID=2646786 RepID=UPI001FD4379C|nr:MULTISPECIES: type VI secretion lipoprotein TssJ [unclassified Caballeronia]MDR5773579.1 type VI secretion lipoprotein TssJ [Caballeronia sp. LZ002]MDR5826798.1 type VI secretion lipoprotein TssJ [Caballeronia sp. LP006]MDR5849013.1 type VI secretion lipoprotein TssJ [Caballeronia sp. LZ003]